MHNLLDSIVPLCVNKESLVWDQMCHLVNSTLKLNFLWLFCLHLVAVEETAKSLCYRYSSHFLPNLHFSHYCTSILYHKVLLNYQYFGMNHIRHVTYNMQTQFSLLSLPSPSTNTHCPNLQRSLGELDF